MSDEEDRMIENPVAAPPAEQAAPPEPPEEEDAAEEEREPLAPKLNFGSGLLPRESQAEKGVGLFTVGGFSVGILYVAGKSRRLGASFSLGLDFSLKELWNPLFHRAVLAEFLATLIFLYVGISTVCMRAAFATAPPEAPVSAENLLFAANTRGAAAQLMIAAAFGFAIFVLVFIFAPISGAHINPAVSFGLALTRKVTVVRMVFYVAAQLGGAVVGTLLAKAVSPSSFGAAGGGALGNGDPEAFSTNGMLLAETMGTLLLVLVVYTVADPQRASSSVSVSALIPFAIGMAVFVAHLCTIPVTGCGINPARAFGPAAVTNNFEDHGKVFWGGPILGATVAAVIYETILKSRNEFEDKWRPS